MSEYELDRETIDRYVRDANQLRSIALGQWLIASWMKLKKSAVATGRRAGLLVRRRQLTLSVPAPHH